MLNKFSITLMLSGVNMTYKSKIYTKQINVIYGSVKLWKKLISNNTLIFTGFLYIQANLWFGWYINFYYFDI